jgi:flagellar hook assembly protein FlgD
MEFKVDATDEQTARKEVELPEGYGLSQNYPNPFNPTTTIDYSLPRSEHVTLEVYNVSGQKVRTLIDEVMPAGNHSVEWDALSDTGTKVASGVYLYRLTAGEVTSSKKMTLLK